MIKDRLKKIPLLTRAVRACAYVRARIVHDAWILRGVERNSGEPLAVLFSGQLENRNYLAHLLFGGTYRERRVRMPGSTVTRLGSGGDTPHALAVMERRGCPAALSAGTFFIPSWIGGEINLAAAERLRRSSGQVYADLRRIRKHAYGFSVERGLERLTWFYDAMYRPYLRNVYGGRAFIVSRTEVQAKAANAEVIVVHERGEPVAGQIMLHEGSRVRGWLIGVKDGDARYVRDGAIAAVYHFATRYLADRGFDRLHAGASRAFLSDGVLRYKRKWGMGLTDATSQGFVLTLVRPSTAVDSFLTRNPFVYQSAGRFYGAVFAADTSAGVSAKQLDMWRLDGMAGFTVFRPSVHRANGARWAAAGFRP